MNSVDKKENRRVQNLSVEDNILLPMSVKVHKRSELNERLEEILEITGLTKKRKYMPNRISGGQRQRVAAARANGHSRNNL